jgi:hypothetical protein
MLFLQITNNTNLAWPYLTNLITSTLQCWEQPSRAPYLDHKKIYTFENFGYALIYSFSKLEKFFESTEFIVIIRH